MVKYDFSGWATRNDIKCSDGRTIRKDAFKHNDGQTVPLVWNHQHNDPLNVLGHALLENRDQGVYAYCTFNDTEAGQAAKELVQHGDVTALSIYANQLKQQGGNVLHGAIREVSLVLAGANIGAYIDSVMEHGEESDEAGIIYTGENIELSHSEEETEPETPVEDAAKKDGEEAETLSHAETTKNTETNQEEKNMATDTTKPEGEETVADVFNTLTDKQKTVVYAMIGQALEDAGAGDEEDEEDMKHNIFDSEDSTEVLSHSDMEEIITDAKHYGSLKESVLAHGITNIDYLFPDAQNVTDMPTFIQRDTGWVKDVMAAVHHTPFSRIKSTFADITEDDARAKGYIKGNLKKEEVFSLLKRSTTPTTIYKKQKLDRDDVIDITDFDVVAFLKSEMRGMLDEEIARAILVGDGRLASSDDKINEQNIRPVWTDADLYTIKTLIEFSATDTDANARAFIKSAVKARKNYKGSGNPVLYTTEDMLTDCLLLEDTTGRILYESADKLATAMRVSKIIAVPVMENRTRTDSDNVVRTLQGIIINLNDYNVGADKGGAVNMFDDFDIDYNAQKYLIETRCSGALTVPYSAIALESKIKA